MRGWPLLDTLCCLRPCQLPADGDPTRQNKVISNLGSAPRHASLRGDVDSLPTAQLAASVEMEVETWHTHVSQRALPGVMAHAYQVWNDGFGASFEQETLMQTSSVSQSNPLVAGLIVFDQANDGLCKLCKNSLSLPPLLS